MSVRVSSSANMPVWPQKHHSAPRKIIVTDDNHDSTNSARVGVLSAASCTIALYDVVRQVNKGGATSIEWTEVSVPRSGVLCPFPPRDAAWCPHSKSSLMTVSKSGPLTLWDLVDGSVHAVYTAYNKMGEHVSANSVLWSPHVFGGGDGHVLAGYGGVEDDTHVRCFDVLREGSDTLWSYQSPLVRSKAGLVSSISALGEGSRLVAVAYQGIAHTVELVDVRHKAVAATLRHDAQRSCDGVVAVRQRSGADFLLYTKPRVRCGGASCVLEWDRRRVSEPIRSIEGVDGESVFDVISFGKQRPLLVDATHETGSLGTYDLSDSSERTQGALETSATAVAHNGQRCRVARAIFSNNDTHEEALFAIGCGSVTFPLRDRWQENEGNTTKMQEICCATGGQQQRKRCRDEDGGSKTASQGISLSSDDDENDNGMAAGTDDAMARLTGEVRLVTVRGDI